MPGKHFFIFLQLFFLEILKLKNGCLVAIIFYFFSSKWTVCVLQNCIQEICSPGTLFCIKIGRIWQHSDVGPMCLAACFTYILLPSHPLCPTSTVIILSGPTAGSIPESGPRGVSPPHSVPFLWASLSSTNGVAARVAFRPIVVSHISANAQCVCRI